MSLHPKFVATVAVHALRAFDRFPGRWRVQQWLAGQQRSLLLMAPRLLGLGGDTQILVEAFNNRDMYTQSSSEDKDELVLLAFNALLRPGDNVLDVGANIGRMTVLASKAVGEAGHVFSFEPSPLVIASLYKNIFFNNCQNVTVKNYAVSDADGLLPFHVPLDTNSGLGSFRDLGKGRSLVIDVPIRQIDQEREPLPTVRLIKIDTEGADLRALRGAEALVKRCRPAIVMEFSPAWIVQMGDDPDWLLDFARRNGYSLYQLSSDGPRALSELPLIQIDLLCTPVPLDGAGWGALKALETGRR